MSRIGISEEAFQQAAEQLGCEPAVIKAVSEVESRGKAFYDDGFPVILFERHIFHKLTSGAYDKSHPEISNPSPGGYGRAGANQRRKFNIAFNLNPEAAMKSCSWGRFQIMGFNHGLCGFKRVGDFVDAMKESEESQLKAFVAFIKSSKLGPALRDKDWALFAQKYNGPAYRKNRYDEKLRQAYLKFAKQRSAAAANPPEPVNTPSDTTSEAVETSGGSPTPPPIQIIEMPKQRPSTFSRISAAITAFVGFVTFIGVNLGVLITEKLREVPVEWFFGGIGALILIAIGIWAYDRSAERSNRLNQKLIDAAADQSKMTVILKAKQ